MADWCVYRKWEIPLRFSGASKIVRPRLGQVAWKTAAGEQTSSFASGSGALCDNVPARAVRTGHLLAKSDT